MYIFQGQPHLGTPQLQIPSKWIWESWVRGEGFGEVEYEKTHGGKRHLQPDFPPVETSGVHTALTGYHTQALLHAVQSVS